MRRRKYKYLTPCPGPHCMPSIHKFFVPGPIDTQSSPVLMVLPVIVTPVELCTWIPSVLGLWSGALSLTLRTMALLQPLITRCATWLLIDVKPLIVMSFAQLNVIDCNFKHTFMLKHIQIFIRKNNWFLSFTGYIPSYIRPWPKKVNKKNSACRPMHVILA